MKHSTNIVITNLLVFFLVQALIIGYVIAMPSGSGSGFGYNKSLDVVIFLEPVFLLTYCVFVMWRLQVKLNAGVRNNFMIMIVSIFPVYLLMIFVANMFRSYFAIMICFVLIFLMMMPFFIVQKRSNKK